MNSTAKSALSKTIRELRARLIEDFDHALEARYRLSKPAQSAGLDEERLAERERIEDWLSERVRGEQDKKKKQRRERADFIAEMVREAAYTLINRLVLLRLMEEAGLQKPAVLKGGWQSAGYREWCEWAPALLDDETDGYATLLGLVFDELAHDLPGLYGEVGLTGLVPVPPQTLRAAVEAIDNDELEPCWSDDTTLGWVYQYFNDPDREALDDKLNSRGKVEPHEVASKTQLFTERYMVEWLLQNSLGQMWLDMCARNWWTPEVVEHGVLDALEERRSDWREKREAGEVELDELMPINSDVEERWKYYVPQGEDVGARAVSAAGAPSGAPNVLDSLRDLKLLDPACGSGHFLVIAFDLLFALYKEEARHRGETWTDEQITGWIIEDNLHGIDIDRRAVQIAAAALYLKGRTQVPDFRPKTLNLVAPDLSIGHLPDDDPALVELRKAVEHEVGIPAVLVDTILRSLQEAYHLGSLLKLDDEIDAALEDFEPREQGDLFKGAATTLDETSEARVALLDALEHFLAHHSSSDDLGLRLHGEQLASGIRFVRLNQEGRYDLVMANPPYLGQRNIRDKKYFKTHYPRSKADLYSAFLDRGLQLARGGGLSAMVTMRGWMFIKTYEELREHFVKNFDLRVIGDLGVGAFEEIGGHVVSATLSVIRAAEPCTQRSAAVNLTNEDVSSSDRTAIKRSALLAQIGRYEFSAQVFEGIDGLPLVYWWPDDLFNSYVETPKFGDVAPARQGMATADNTRFLRKVWEAKKRDLALARTSEHVKPRNLTHKEWWPYIKGAAGKCWYEPVEDVARWRHFGLQIRAYERSVIRNEDFYLKQGVAFAAIGDTVSARMHRYRSLFDVMGQSAFPDFPPEATCAVNSATSTFVLKSLNPTVHFQVGDINRLPLFPVEAADEIYAQLDEAFTEHEAARETSVEFKKPGPSCWKHAQTWAQQAVDRPEGEPLPEWEPEYDEAPPENWLSWAVGVAVGRFDAEGEQGWLDEAPEDAIDAGILYVSATDFDDALADDACTLLHQMWEEHGDEVGRNKDDLSSWLREKFFKDVHRQMYDNAPIYFPVSSQDKNFVAHINIHRWEANTLRRLLAEWLMPEKKQLEQLRDNLRSTRDSSEGRAKSEADKRLEETKDLLEELEQFIADVRQCAEFGPPATDSKCPERECDATYEPVLDDGTMINAAALWPILDPQWSKYPKKWWKRLANEKGYRGKHFDWSMLAARYWPTRVDEKCQEDPSLAVAHGCFWKYHPERAYEWELRLHDEIGPDFTIDEPDADERRERFLREQPEKAREIEEDEMARRKREAKKAGEPVEEVQPVLV